ncbi:hypothetical protein SAMN04490186_3907 [Pseudomonas grimontii]|uniref:DUF4238 domain-containing protein n=1 Tax=Pseudomonas grimontii TaxID=129847 RepID=A0A1H1H1K4_9PSED|nr:DUF4238 domain-containing protein [Pseudomonas grimontii]TWR52347.1 hypothetical protein FIV39_32400 [Pseudomonas grimontii]SDR19375.1 hypothetical protein SAMN04490186_3907 [Pseudomonas grimontii]
MGFEAPQKGNPHKLTIKQHVFPRKSIDRFSDESGLVQLFRTDGSKVISANSTNNLFCAKRAWDQSTESGIGKHIEDRFQALVESILAGSTEVIGYFEKTVVEDFFSLWRARQKFRAEGLDDLKLEGRVGDSLTKDEQEILERQHVMFCRDGVMPGRFAARIHVFGYMNTFRQDNRHMQWGIVRAGEGEFIVPDCFQDMMIVPVSPKLMIVADQPNSTLTRSEVAVINQTAIDRSTDYYFARSLSACPVYRDSPPRLQRIFAN